MQQNTSFKIHKFHGDFVQEYLSQTLEEFKNSLTRKRACNMALSQTKFNVSSSSVGKKRINILKIDETECRYMLASYLSGKLCLFDLDHGEVKNKVTPLATSKAEDESPPRIGHLAWWLFDPGLFVSSTLNENAEISVWDTRAFTKVSNIRLKRLVYCHEINASSQVACGTMGSGVVIVDLKTRSSSLTFADTSRITSLAWSPRNSWVIATGDSEGLIRLWDVRKSNYMLSCLDELNQAQNYNSYNPAHGTTSTNKRMKGQFHESAINVKSHSNAIVNQVRFVEGGASLFSAGTNGVCRLWKATPRGYENTFVDYGRDLFMPNKLNNKSLGFANEGGVNLLFSPRKSHANIISGMDLLSGKKLFELKGHLGAIDCLAYRAFNEQLYSSSDEDDLILKWEPKRSDSAWEKHTGNEEEEKDTWSEC